MLINVFNVREVSYENSLQGYYNINESDSDVFKIKILNENNEILYEKWVYVSFFIFDIGEVNYSSLSFTLPKLENVKTFKLIYKGEEKFSLNLPSILCNNNKICDNSENYLSCPDDCLINAKDGICMNAKENEEKDYWEDGVCDEDCYKDDDCYKRVISYYKFEDSFDDELGNNPGEGIGGVQFVNSKEGFGRAASFNGSSRVEIEDLSIQLSSDNLTVSAWVYWQKNLGRYNMILGQNLPYLGLLNSSQLIFSVRNKTGLQISVASKKLISRNRWYHVAGTYDGTYLKIYADGVLIGSKKAEGGLSYVSGKYNMTIGAQEFDGNTAPYPFKGMIDEVKIYNHALSQEEIKQEYTSGGGKITGNFVFNFFAGIINKITGFFVKEDASENVGLRINESGN